MSNLDLILFLFPSCGRVEGAAAKKSIKGQTEAEKKKKSEQAARRKLLKEQQMEAEKDAIIQKYSNLVNKKMEEEELARAEKEAMKAQVLPADICYQSKKEGNYLSFAHGIEVPMCLSQKAPPTLSSKR